MFPYLIMLNNYHRHVKEHPTLSPASTKFVSSSNQNTTPFLSFYVSCELSSTPNQSALALQERNCELPWQKAAFFSGVRLGDASFSAGGLGATLGAQPGLPRGQSRVSGRGGAGRRALSRG